MEVKIIPHPVNRYPLQGILVKGSVIRDWLSEIQILGISLSEVQVFPIPNDKPDSVWGCLILFIQQQQKINSGRHECCQCISPNLYIAERADIFPTLHQNEIDQLFSSGKYLFHPTFGCVELPDPVDFTDIITLSSANNVQVTRPFSSVKIPSQIRNFLIQPLAPEQVLSKLEHESFPKHEEMKEDGLNPIEKIKLGFYRLFFRKSVDKEGSSTTHTRFGSWLKSVFKSEKEWDTIQDNFEELERRNQEQLEKLMDLLKNDPKEGLKYAIPLDPGTGRGMQSESGSFSLGKRWSDFSLFSNLPSSGRGITLTKDDHFDKLRGQYVATAEELIRRKEYQEAAFVYMKLLKDYLKAADTMEAGHYYQEAATIHLKHTGHELQAARCYEKGNMLMNAIEIYAKRNDDEKAGDLYMRLNNREAAFEHYEKVVERYKRNNQYLKASFLYRDKMDNTTSAQSLLLEGWRNRIDAVNCLKTYFSNIHDDEELHKEIQQVYRNDIGENNREMFIAVIKNEYGRKPKLRDSLREIAFETIADTIPINPDIVSELKNFNPDNKELIKDTLRFKLGKGK